MNQIAASFLQEIKRDFKNPTAILGALLFLCSSLFVCYISINKIHTISTWVALYWVVVIFASFNAIAKSMVNETRARMLYLYTLVSPVNFIVSKMLYNAVLLIVLSGLAQLIYSVFFAIEINDNLMLWLGIVLGSTGLAMTLSILGSIASKASGNFTLMSILGLPLLLPLILSATRFTKNAIDGIDWSIQWKYLIVLIGLNAVCFALSVVLFPYLWRE